jgi:hypothetical protein
LNLIISPSLLILYVSLYNVFSLGLFRFALFTRAQLLPFPLNSALCYDIGQRVFVRYSAIVCACLWLAGACLAGLMALLGISIKTLDSQYLIIV